MHEYEKAPQYVGKKLAINTGRREVTIMDPPKTYVGREWAKYVAQGLLVPVKGSEAPKPAPAPAPAPKAEPKPVEPKAEPRGEETKPETPEAKPEPAPEPQPVKDEGTVTKSPAAKRSGIGGVKQKPKGKGKGKGKK